MSIDKKQVIKLREKTGIGIMDCKKALMAANGDIAKAEEYLRKQGQRVASKKEGRQAAEGLVECYLHATGKVGAMVVLNCETDFVARNREFKELAHDLAMQVAAAHPQYISEDEIPEEVVEKEKEIYREQLKKENKPDKIIDKIIEGKLKKFYQDVCLLNQPFIKNDKITIKDLIVQKISKLGEKIKVQKFVRFSL